MIQNYVLITMRNLMRNKVFILINVLGLGFAIACCIVAYLNWDFSRSFDSTHRNSENIYRVQCWQDTDGVRNRYAVAPTPLGSMIKENIAAVDRVIRYSANAADFRIGDEVFNTNLAYADSAFFEYFNFQLKSGSLTSFHTKSNILLNETVALKYFNSVDVTGRQITQLINGTFKEFTVGAVFADQPLNSSFAFDAICLWDNISDINTNAKTIEADWTHMSTLFIHVPDKRELPQVVKGLQSYLEPQNRAREDFKLSEYYLEKFGDLAEHFYGETWLQGDQLRSGIPPSSVFGPAFMAGLLLLLACFNFTNTSLAISGKRLKEIGIRKAMGGVRRQLVFQFMNESLILSVISLVFGVLISRFLVPAYNQLWPGIKLSFSQSDTTLLFSFLVILVLVISLIAGTYPAFYVSSFRPAAILKGTTKLGSTNWFTRILLTFQFSIALICIVSGIAFFRNAQYQNNYDLGYAKNGIIRVPLKNYTEFDTYKNALSKNREITVVAGSVNHVSDGYEKATIRDENTEHQVELLAVGVQYLEAMDISITQGRAFTTNSGTDQKESVLVSEEFVKQFGWTGTITGRRLVWRDTIQLYVVGVVRDIHTEGFWKPVAPVMIRYAGPDQYRQVVVRTDSRKVSEVNAFMKEEWKKISPNTLYPGKVTDGNLNASAMINKNTMAIFGFLGIVAVFMAATGLYALVSLNILKRTKEIGIRKILGASAAHLATIINFEFFVILALSSLLGGVVGFMFSDTIMDAIWEYYLQMEISSVSLASLTLVIIALATVSYKTLSTAFSNPIHALRDE